MTKIKAALVAAAALVLSACFPTFENAPKGAGPTDDPALIGIWEAKDEGKTALVLTITKDPAAARLVIVMSEPGATKPDEMPTFHGETLELAGQKLALLTPTGEAATGGEMPTGVWIFRYSISGGKLSVEALDDRKITAAIESGRLAGSVSGTKPSQKIQISDTSEKVAAFFSSDEGKAAFLTSDVEKLAFERKTP